MEESWFPGNKAWFTLGAGTEAGREFPALDRAFSTGSSSPEKFCEGLAEVENGSDITMASRMVVVRTDTSAG
jgi:hypothetical protein